jgi:hypothetical protein
MCREARFGVAVGVREHHLFEKEENKIATTKSLILAQDER